MLRFRLAFLSWIRKEKIMERRKFIRALAGTAAFTSTGAGLLLSACGKKSPDDSKVFATVNSEAITEKDYEDYLRARQTQQPPIPDKEKERKVVLDEMVNRVLLVQSAAEHKEIGRASCRERV